MKQIALLILGVLLSLFSMAQDLPGGSRAQIQARRQYPGGRDDSDLTVQVLPQLKKKSQLDQEMPLDSEGGDLEGMDLGSETPAE